MHRDATGGIGMPILRTSQVTALTGLSRTTLWRLEKADAFPARVQLGANSVGWRSEEVQAWIENRPRGMTNAVVYRSYNQPSAEAQNE